MPSAPPRRGPAASRSSSPLRAGCARPPARPEYFPLTYVVSELGDPTSLGIDVGLDPARGPTLRRARDTGLPASPTWSR